MSKGMNGMKKLLIVDSNEEFRETLAQALGKQYSVMTCGSGLRALELLAARQTDLMILELMLPGMDGLRLLRQAALSGLTVPSLALSRYFGDYAIDAAGRLGVEYMMLKPCEVSAVVERVADLLDASQPEEPLFQEVSARSAATTLLLELNLLTKHRGFNYALDAIIMLAQTPNQQITKTVYPEIAKQYRTSSTAVEKCIRDAIASAYLNRNEELWNRLFPTAPDGTLPRPTNSIFLTRLAQELVCTKGARRRA